MHFSYSTIKNCLQPDNSHNWLNKLWEIKHKASPAMKAGGENQRIIQMHVSGEKKDPRLSYLTETFPIVEKRQFDKDCKFTLQIGSYEVIGYFDGKDPDRLRSLEIKLSGGLNGKNPTPWSIGDFRDSMQRKIYTLAEPTYKTSVIITGSLNPDHWGNEMTRLKVREVENTEQDKKEAMKWLEAGIAVFESGDYTGGLDENGRCIMGRMCPWGDDCHFKHI